MAWMPKPPSKETVFVRSMPTATPEDVVEAAKKAGLKLDLDRVAKVRDYDLARARLKAKKAGKAPEKPGAAAASKATKTKASKKVSKKIASAPSNNAEATKSAENATTMTKAAYVRSLGPKMMPAEIMDRAKADGVKLTLAYVYNLRKTAKKKGAKTVAAKAASAAPKKRGPGRAPKVANPAPSNSPVGGDEKALRSALAEFIVAKGLGAAKAIVEDVAEKIRRAVAG